MRTICHYVSLRAREDGFKQVPFLCTELSLFEKGHEAVLVGPLLLEGHCVDEVTDVHIRLGGIAAGACAYFVGVVSAPPF